jgi:hypothetical protein
MQIGCDGSVHADFEWAADDNEWQDATGSDTEFRTPPLTLKTGLPVFKNALRLMKRYSVGRKPRLITNHTCGLHVNLSEHWATRNHLRWCRFYTHLIRLFPEFQVLSTFNRSDCYYCRPLFATAEEARKQSFERLYSSVRSCQFGQNKYHSCGLYADDLTGADDYDLSARDNWRVEFRALGGDNYHKRPETLKTVHSILEIAQEAYLLTRKDEGKSAERVNLLPTNRKQFAFSVPTAITAGA